MSEYINNAEENDYPEAEKPSSPLTNELHIA